MPSSAKKRAPALTGKDWLDAGQRLLRTSGARALGLRALSRALGISTGSFYHHFESFDQYLAELADYYHLSQLQSNLATVREGAGDPREKLVMSARMAMERGWDRTSMAMRDWGKTYPAAAAAVRATDGALAEFFAQCFLDMGLSARQAALRSHILLAMGSSPVRPQHDVGPPDFAINALMDMLSRP
ncbi:MAG: TetR/AcrR family transcriptional regulator [Sphingopyxis sp.]